MAKDATARYILTAEDRTRAAFESVRANFEKLDRIAEALKVATVGVLSIEGVAKFLEITSEAEKASTRLTAAINAQGHAAGFTRQQLEDMADELSQATPFDDEAFKNGEAQLLKFGGIYNDVFERALKDSADLAAFNGTDLAGGIDAIGKALQSPADGFKQLQQQIGKFTPEQKKMLDDLVAQNKQVEAQSYLLDILEKKIAGTAATMNGGYSRALTDTKKSFDELIESIGKVGALQNTVQGFFGFLNQSMRDLKSIIESGDWFGGLLFLYGFRGHDMSAQSKSALVITGIETQIKELQDLKKSQGFTFTDDEGRTLSDGVSERIVELQKQHDELKKLYDDTYLQPAIKPPPHKNELTKEQQDFLDALQKQRQAIDYGGDQIGGLFAQADQLHILERARPLILDIAGATLAAADSAAAAKKAFNDWERATNFIENLKDETSALRDQTKIAQVASLPGEVQKWSALAKMSADAQKQARTMGDGLANEFLKQSAIEQTAWAKAWDENYAVVRSFGYGFRTTMGEIYEDATNTAEQTRTLFTGVFQQLEDLWVNWAKTGKFSVHDLADYAVTQLLRIQAQQMIIAPLSTALNAAGGGLAALIGRLGGGATSGAGAYGPTSSGGGGFSGMRAMGGPVMAGSTYLVGERGPELFTPGVSGNITPNGGASQTINVDMTGSLVTKDAVADLYKLVNQVNRSIPGQAVAAVTSARRRGVAGLR